jgi:uncharacterized protein (TIGR03437 family)
MHMHKRLLIAVAALAGTLAAQTPTITGIVNASSARPPGLPNSAIAQGSIFVVYGSNLGAAAPAGSLANLASMSMPLPTTAGLAGTTITVTVNGVTLPAPILYTIPGQVAAIMPSATPVGSGTLTLTYNGKSAMGPILVQITAFGISNLRTANGFETAYVVFGTNQNELVTGLDSAAPGDIVVMYGTGLGPAIEGFDTILPLAGNLGTAPMVYVGGVPSTAVLYYGRSPALPGLDQIVFVVPQNAPLGCQVSIIVETSNVGVPIVSNGPTTALATTDHTPCVDPVDEFPPSALTSGGNFSGLIIALVQNTTFTAPNTSTTSGTELVVTAQFTPAQLFAYAPTMAKSSFNSCLTGFVPNPPPMVLPNGTFLNAGPSVTLTPPSGAAIAIPTMTPGFYLGTNSVGIPSGAWNLAVPGGANVGPLNVGFPIPQPIVWTNQASLLGSTIDRTKGLTITWTGGDPNGYVDIQSFGQNTTGAYLAGYDCSVPISAGTFTIPPSALLHMPPGAGAMTTLQVSTFSLPFTTPPVAGFSALGNFSQLSTVIPIVYK